MRYLQMYNVFEKFYVQTPELTGKLKIPGGQFPSQITLGREVYAYTQQNTIPKCYVSAHYLNYPTKHNN